MISTFVHSLSNLNNSPVIMYFNAFDEYCWALKFFCYYGIECKVFGKTCKIDRRLFTKLSLKEKGKEQNVTYCIAKHLVHVFSFPI